MLADAEFLCAYTPIGRSRWRIDILGGGVPLVNLLPDEDVQDQYKTFLRLSGVQRCT